jgi:uncharacterized protein HemX
LPDFLHSPEDLLLALLFASTLALGACLWLVWSEMRRLARRERKMVRETENYMHQQLAALNEKLSGEMSRQRRETENVERNLEAAMRRRLDELQGLIESLRILESKLQARLVSPPAEQPPGTIAKETRAGFSVIARPPKPGSRENSG